MNGDARFFARPQHDLWPLSVNPVLASWDAKGSPAQLRLETFVGHALHVLGPHTPPLEAGPLALVLHVGLPDDADWLAHHDLDNYAFPLTMRVQQRMGRHLDCVWVSKARGGGSRIALVQAAPCDQPTGAAVARIRTHTSAESSDFKKEVRKAVSGLSLLPEGPVALELSYLVGKNRNWPNLWKPTIDALGPLLGSEGVKDWHPRDGRITELGLHRRVDTSIGHDVDIAIVARNAPPE